MSKYHDIRVGILSGGPSSRYDDSLETGKVLLSEAKDIWGSVKPIYIDREGNWRREDGTVVSPSQARHLVDVMVNGLHGEYGEDGKVQQILEHMRLPYTGSSILSSALAMHKYRMREKLKELPVRQPVYRMVRRDEVSPELIRDIYYTFPFPLVVKPILRGSSVGTGFVQSVYDLEVSFEQAFRVADAVILEEYVSGKGAICGIVEGYRGEDAYVLPVIEVSSANGHQSALYGSAGEIIPGRFTEKERSDIQRMSKMVHTYVNLRDYSLAEFTVHPKRGVFLSGISTLPALSTRSVFPQMLRSVGGSLGEFLEHIVARAYKRG